MAKKLAPIHLGEVLLADFLEPNELSQYRLAHSISVPPRRINEIVHAKRAVTADTALRLARFFGTSEQFWLNLQARHDLEVERDRLGARLKAEVAVFAKVRLGGRLLYALRGRGGSPGARRILRIAFTEGARVAWYRSQRSCSVSQNSADIPKSCSRRSAVSVVTPRFPLIN